MRTMKNVMTLNQWDFNYALSRYEFLVVFFYDPKCPVSWKFSADYSLAAGRLRREGDCPIHFAMVDVSEPLNKYLVMHYKIWRDPTVKIFRDGGKVIEDYTGLLDDQGFTKCMKSLTMPFPPEITSFEQLNHLKNIVIVGVFPDFVGPAYEMFVKVAEKFRWDYDFYKYLSVGDSGYSLGFFNLFKDSPRFFKNMPFHIDALEEFVTAASPHVVTWYDEHNQQFVDDFFRKAIENDKAILLINRRDRDACALESSYRQIAKKYRILGINFMLVDFKDHEGALLHFDVTEREVPITTHTIVIQTPSREIYVTSDLNDIDGWLKDFRLG